MVFLNELVGLKNVVREALLIKLRALLAQNQKTERLHDI